MRCAGAIPLPLLVLSLAIASSSVVYAQHGHAGSLHSSGGMHPGAFASHAAPPSRSFSGLNRAPGMRPSGPARFAPPTRIQPGRAFTPSSPMRMRVPGSLRINPGVRRPEYGQHRPGYGPRRPEYPDHRHHPHRPEYNYGGSVLYTGSILPYGLYDPYWNSYGGFGFPYDDDADTDPSAYADSGQGNNYVAETAPEASAPEAPTPPAPSDTGSPYSYGSQPQASAPQPPIAEPPQPFVTLVFNNGAPNRQIHNYILSRSKLIILDGPRSEIPVAEIDLPATQRANRDAGIDFHLPQ